MKTRIKHRLLLVMALSCLFALPAHAGSCNAIAVPSGVTSCFYADLTSGLDTATGADETHAWKHIPGMTGCTSLCAANTPAAGSGYIIKGGTSTTLSTSNTWHWTTSGSNGSPIYIGIDPSWNLGALTAITPTSPGYNCTSLTVVLSGGGGTGGAGTANFQTTGYLAGLLQHVTITNAGSGYTSNPTVSFTGSCTTFPTAVADITRPILDGTGTIWTESNGAQSSFGPIVFGASWLVVDHLDIRNVVFDHTITQGSGSLYAITQQSGDNDIWEGIYLHNTGNDEALGFNGSVTCTGTAVTKTGGDNFITGSAWNGQLISINGVGYAISSVSSATTLTVGASCTSGSYFKPTFNGTGLFQIDQGASPTNVTLKNSFLDNYENELQVPCGYNNDGSFASFAAPCGSSQGVQGAVNLQNNFIHDCRGCAYSGVQQNNLWDSNVMWDVIYDCCAQHVDAYYFFGGGVVSNNYLIGVAPLSGANFYIETTGDGVHGNTTYLFNNVGWGLGVSTNAIGFTSEFYSTTVVSPSPSLFAYNNTFYGKDGTNSCINAGQWFGISAYNPSSFSIFNNHCITDQSQGHWFNVVGYSAKSTASVTAWSINGSNVATLTAANSFAAGLQVSFSGFVSGAAIFNGVTGTVLSAGLSGTQFEVAITHATASGSETTANAADVTCGTNNLGCGTWNTLNSPNASSTQTTIDAQNTVMSPTTATSQGYVFGNNFAPTLLTNSTVTAALSNFTSTCSTSTNGVSLTGLCTGILGNARPNAAWQSGAYQFAGGGVANPPAPARGMFAFLGRGEIQ